jgi:hypothetical protein
MKRWFGLLAILPIIIAVPFGYWWWRHTPLENRFVQIENGMTLDQVHAVMGRADMVAAPFGRDTAREGSLIVLTWRGSNGETFHVLLEGGQVTGKHIDKSGSYSLPPAWKLK